MSGPTGVILTFRTQAGTIVFGPTHDYNSVGQWHNEPLFGSPEYEKQYYSLSGDDGQGIKRHGFRQCKHGFIVTYVGSSEGNLEATWFTHTQALANTSIDVEFDILQSGVVIPRCELEATECKLTEMAPMGNGLWMASGLIHVNQIGLVSILH